MEISLENLYVDIGASRVNRGLTVLQITKQVILKIVSVSKTDKLP